MSRARRTAAQRVNRWLRDTFIVNDFGIWCPSCGERIDDFWPASCDACGYPDEDCDIYDADDYFEDQITPASGIEAATADETRSGSAEGESPAPEGGDAQ